MLDRTAGLRGRGGILSVLLIALACVLGVVVLGAAPAAAHTELQSSDPEDGSTVTEVPDRVSFTFADGLMAQGGGINAIDTSSGRSLELSEAEVDGNTIRADWPAATPAGSYTVSYRVVASDGHPIEGSVEFTMSVPAGSPQATIQAPQSTETPATPPATTPAASPTPEPEDEGSSLLGFLIGFVIVVIVGGVLGMWIMKRANRI